MTVESTHSKNPLADWDVTASAKAEKGEKIARAQILVNGRSEYDESFDPAMSTWRVQLTQKGQYPGDNMVQVIITDENGTDTGSDDEWAS
ncbi:MAG TPA: hypothetical protein VMR80_02840 [Candidatus Acidoferrum sp.]|nr:hypothetical protein [Candidatus Acidoferrum sp.]